MKKVILGVHTSNDRNIKYWVYDLSTAHYWDKDVCNYAIVDTRNGYQLVRVLGHAEVSNEVMAEKRVISFLSNDNFPNNYEQNSIQE